MKIRKNLFLVPALLTMALCFSQQIGSGVPPISIDNFNKELPSGFYQGLYATGSVDGSAWYHLLNLRHSNPTNNHQLQIASGYGEDGSLFFRKFSRGSLGVVSPAPVWNEIATRGDNTFTGSQIIQGGLTSSLSNNEGGYISLNNPSKTANGIGASWKIYNMTGSYGNSLQFYVYDNLGCVPGGLCAPRLTLLDSGNVGIGTTTPSAKLDVNGDAKINGNLNIMALQFLEW